MSKKDTIFSAKTLHYFLQLISTMNYTQAAQILGITQPALTQQIKKLERAIGTPLFGQVGKKLYLTEAGKEMQRGAVKLLDTINSVVDDIQEFTQADTGEISIGILENIDSEVLRKFLVEFDRHFPDITFKIVYFNREELWYRLDNNLVDLAIMYLPDNTKKDFVDLQQQYDYSDIYHDRLMILTHQDNLKALQEYPVDTFKDTKWVAYPDDYYLSQLMQSYMGKGTKLDAPISFSTIVPLIATANETNYDTYISKSCYESNKTIISKNYRNLTPIYLSDERDFTISLVYRKGKRGIPRVANLLDQFKKFLDKFGFSAKLDKG